MQLETFINKKWKRAPGFKALRQEGIGCLLSYANVGFIIRTALIYKAANPWILKGKVTTSCLCFWLYKKAWTMRTISLDRVPQHFVTKVRKYLARKGLPFKVLWYWKRSWSPKAPWVQHWSYWTGLLTLKRNVPNLASRSGRYKDLWGSLHMTLCVKDCQCNGREPQERKVWEDYTTEDAVIVIGKVVKLVKPGTINSCWSKLCPRVVYDFTGFMTEPIKEIMKKIVDIIKKVGCEGFQGMGLREIQKQTDTTPEELTEDTPREMGVLNWCQMMRKKTYQKQSANKLPADHQVDASWLFKIAFDFFYNMDLSMI